MNRGSTPCSLASAEDDPIEVAIAGQGDVRRYSFHLGSGINRGCKYGTEKESGKIRQKEKGDYGKGGELSRAQMGYSGNFIR